MFLREYGIERVLALRVTLIAVHLCEPTYDTVARGACCPGGAASSLERYMQLPFAGVSRTKWAMHHRVPLGVIVFCSQRLCSLH
eukprot:2688116-Amphidinium_carterae.2